MNTEIYKYSLIPALDLANSHIKGRVSCWEFEKEAARAFLRGYENPEGRTDETRAVASQHAPFAFYYAQIVDNAPSDMTRNGAARSPFWSLLYAAMVDKHPHPQTRCGCLQSPAYAYEYALEIEKAPADDTRKAASASVFYALQYATNVDCGPHPVTMRGVSSDSRVLATYNERFGKVVNK